MARQTISKQMKEFGIQTRGAGTVQNRKRGLAYGRKVKDREIVVHKKEQEDQRVKRARFFISQDCGCFECDEGSNQDKKRKMEFKICVASH